MLLIQILLIILAIAVVLYFRYQLQHTGGAMDLQLRQARTELENRQVTLKEMGQQIHELADAGSPDKYGAAMQEGVIRQGMPAVLLTLTWGPPDQVQQEADGAEIWTYRSLEAGAPGTAVTLKNKQVLKLVDI